MEAQEVLARRLSSRRRRVDRRYYLPYAIRQLSPTGSIQKLSFSLFHSSSPPFLPSPPPHHVPRETRLLRHPHRQCHRRPLRRPLPSAKYVSLVFRPKHQDDYADSIPVGWGRTQTDPAFGAMHDNSSVKAKSVNLIASVRTVMRSTYLRGPAFLRALATCPVS